MRPLKAAAVMSCGLVLGYAAVARSVLSNGSFTATWTPATDQSEQYEFRWRHFATSAWIPLATVPGSTGSLAVTFPALPATPTTDRWACVDARMVKPTVGPWLSETADGPACNAVEVGAIVVPTPPAPVPPPVPPAPVPPPVPPQPDIFTNVQQRDGRLSIDYQVGACPRGVQQTSSAVNKNGLRTITLTCRR